MLKCVASKRSVVHFDVHLEVLVEVVSLQESDNSLSVNIILMLRWFHWFRLNEECSLETLSTSIIASHGEHSSHVLFLAFLVSVEEAHVAFTSTPEHIVLSTELDTCIDSVLDLHDSTRHHVEVRVSGSTIHITSVTEHIGS